LNLSGLLTYWNVFKIDVDLNRIEKVRNGYRSQGEYITEVYDPETLSDGQTSGKAGSKCLMLS